MASSDKANALPTGNDLKIEVPDGRKAEDMYTESCARLKIAGVAVGAEARLKLLAAK